MFTDSGFRTTKLNTGWPISFLPIGRLLLSNSMRQINSTEAAFLRLGISLYSVGGMTSIFALTILSPSQQVFVSFLNK